MPKGYQTNYSNIGIQSVHDRQLLNLAYQKYRKAWEENPREDIVANFPLNIDLEVTNDCNLHCHYCARTQKNWGENEIGYVKEEIVEKVINEINREGGYSMKFSLRGEPLLHHQLIKFLGWAKNSKLVDFYFNTNGMLLSKDFSRAFVDLQTPRISISVGGWDDESFSRCQVGADLKTVMANVKYLKKYRDKAGFILPQIRIQAVSQNELNLHLDEFKNMWGPLAEEVGLVDFREETGAHNYAGNISSSFCCNFLWQRLVVLWDGSVYPCLFHGVRDNKNLYLGNVRNTSLKEMWNGEKINRLRKLHKGGFSHSNSCCDNCSYRFSVIKKNEQNILN